MSLIESMMPIPFIAPGAKLGLSNIVILITLVVFGFKEALIVGMLKSFVFTLVTGSVSSLFLQFIRFNTIFISYVSYTI